MRRLDLAAVLLRRRDALVMALAVALVSMAMLGCRGRGFLVEIAEARQTTADLRVDFSRAADASNRAVMASTDELSTAFAREAEAARGRVNRHREELGELLHHLEYAEELRAFDDFSRRLAEYETLDRQILALAVENTNLKAQRLAFGPAREAADAFRSSLEGLLPALTERDGCRARDVVARAVLAVREIEVLLPPHIAEAKDQAMTRFESEMDARRLAARAALDELSALIDAKSPGLSQASAALDRFEKTRAEIMKLSRSNTNVVSLELALGKKPALTAACEDSLRALELALSKEEAKGTR